MNFKRLLIICCLFCFISISFIPCAAFDEKETYYPKSVLNNYNRLIDYIPLSLSSLLLLEQNQYSYQQEYDPQIINNHINYYIVKKNEAENFKYYASLLGYDESHPIIIFANSEINNFNFLIEQYQIDYDIWTERINKYPVASKIWIYLKTLGYNDYVCAGILGNIMAETGGNTFDIQHWLFDNKVHYGMCQWNIDYYEEVNKADLDKQLEFLKETIKKEFNNFGYIYSEGFKYEHFINMNNYNETALAFAKIYERCSSSSYQIRQQNAKIAFNYFH